MAGTTSAVGGQLTTKAMYSRSSPLHTPMWVTLFVAAFGGLVYGYNVSSDGYLGGLQHDFHVGTFATELVSGGAALGAMLTMPISGVLADKIGRRTTVLLGCIPAIVGSGLVSMAASPGQAIAWRVLQGSGNAIAIHVVPIYLSEVAPPAHRAIIVALFQFFVSAGLTAQPLVQLWFGEWRVTAACGVVAPAVLAVLGVFGMGRSPVWVQSRGARSYQSLAVDSGAGATASQPNAAAPSTRRGSGVGVGTGAVAGDSASDGGTDVEQASPLLTAQATKRGAKHAQPHQSRHAAKRAPAHRHGSFNVAATAAAVVGDVADGVGGAPRTRCGTGAAACIAAWLAPLYTQPQWATLLTLGVVLAWTNNSTDIFMFYGVQVLEDAGFSGRSPLVLYALLSGCTAVMVAPAMCLIAALPRRPLFLASFAAVVVTFFAQAVAFSDIVGTDAAKPMIVTWMVVFVIAFQSGPGTMFLLLLSEINPVQCRGVSVSIATFFMSGFSVLLNGTLLTTIQAFGSSAVFASYGVAYLLCLVYLVWKLPETKGRDLRRTDTALAAVDATRAAL